MSVPLSQLACAGPEVGPACLDLGRVFGLADAGFRCVLCTKGCELFGQTDKVAQVLRHRAPEPEHAGLRMGPRLRHSQGHLYHPIVSLGLP